MESIRDDLKEILEKQGKTGTVVFSEQDQAKILDSLETQLLKKVENLPSSLPDLRQVGTSTSDELTTADAGQMKALLMEQVKGMVNIAEVEAAAREAVEAGKEFAKGMMRSFIVEPMCAKATRTGREVTAVALERW